MKPEQVEINEITLAAVRCRSAWANHPNARLAWCCHHETRLEFLTSPVEGRINYILRHKDINEQATRLNNFRPYIGHIPTTLQKLIEQHDMFVSRSNNSWRRTLYNSLKVSDVRTEIDDLLNTLVNDIHEQHQFQVPDNTWNGRSIFNK